MKKFFKKYIEFIESLGSKHHYYKMLIAENYALYRKRSLINTVKWNKKEEKDFKLFWKENYKDIKSSGNKLFQAFNSKYHKNYIPDFLYATKIESSLNNYNYGVVYSDKSLTEILYKDKSSAKLPQTYLLKTGGVYYDSDRNIIDTTTASKILLNLNKAVIKPTVGGNSGKGVVIADFNEKGIDVKNNFNILDLLKDNVDDIIVQEKIKQSNELNTLYPNSINTIRVITYIAKNKVRVAPVSLRLGVGGKLVDNIHAGGLVIGVNHEEEVLKKMAYQLGYSDNVKKFTNHPDTNVLFDGFKVNGVKECIDSAIKLHGFTPKIGIISWDMTINSTYDPIIIEANYLGQSIWFPQIVNEEPIFGEHSEYMLKFIK